MLGKIEETGYSRVSTGDTGSDEPRHEPELPNLHPWKRNVLLLCLLVSVLTSLVVGAISSAAATSAFNHFHFNFNTSELATHAASASSSKNGNNVEFTDDCGDTPAKARARGCTFDTMMQLWVPPACLDAHLTERFVAEGNWTWYEDQRAQHPIPYEVLSQGEHEVAFAADDYHRAHCFYTWEALVRALRTRGPIMEEMMSYDHVMHCKMMGLMPTRVNSTIGVEIHPGYTRCAPYETWIYNLPADEHSSSD